MLNMKEQFLNIQLTLDGKEWSGEEFSHERNRLKDWLSAAGVKPDSVLLLPGLSNGALAFLTPAALSLQVSLVLLPPSESRDISLFVALSGAQWLCSEHKITTNAYEAAGRFEAASTPLWLHRIKCPATRPFSGNGVIYFTSGTTAASRAVFREWDKLFAEVAAYQKHLAVSRHAKILALVPLFHSYGFGSALINALSLGGHLYAASQLMPASLRQLLQTEHYDLAIASPQTLWLCAQAIEETATRCAVKRAISSGAPLSLGAAEAVKKSLGWAVRQQYGSSETGAISVDQCAHSDPSTVGQPLPGVSVTVTANGEIEVVSPYAATRYLQDNARGKFTGGAFRPGDCGHFNLAGALFVTGRVDDEVAVAGKRVRLHELQLFLQALPGVELARVHKNVQNDLVCGLRVELYGEQEDDMVIERITERFGSFPLQVLLRRADDAAMQGVIK